MITYEGATTRLRPLRASDVARSIAWRNDPETREAVLGHRLPVTEEMERRWLESALAGTDPSKVVFAVETLEDGRLIGFIHLARIDWIGRTGWLGITIGERGARGRGHGPDALRTLCRYAFDALNLRKVCLEVVAFNEHALAVYERFGFQVEGRLRAQAYLEDRYHDVVVMSLFADAFRESDRPRPAPSTAATAG